MPAGWLPLLLQAHGSSPAHLCTALRKIRPVEPCTTTTVLCSLVQTARWMESTTNSTWYPLVNTYRSGIYFFLEPLAVSIDDFTPGRAKGPLTSGNLHLGVLICYESIFPTIARDTTALGANVLVNITNDAWYGRSKAPVQSLAMAVLRAVENRRALVRSANTGISGFIDPLGRTSEESAIFTEAAAVASMPLMQSRTVFTRIGHRFGLLCALLILPLILPQFLRQLAKNGKTPPLGKVPAKKVARS